MRELHGERVEDDYAWMRRGGAELHDHLAAERAYYEAQTQRLAELAHRLAAEAAARTPSADEYSVAWPLRGFTYRARIPAGADNEQFLRALTGEADEQLLLDANLLAGETGFALVGVREPSPDGNLLAWSVDRAGAEVFELHIRDLRSGGDLPEVIERTYAWDRWHGHVVWSADARHLFYLVADELNRPCQVWRHELGTPVGEDALIFEEADARFDLSLHGARSGELAIITARSRDTTEVRLIDLTDPLAVPIVVTPRRQGIEYYVDHARGEDALYIVTDATDPEFSLMRAALAAPEEWRALGCGSVAPARADTRLHDAFVFSDRLVLSVRRGCEPLLVITDHDGEHPLEIGPQRPASTIRLEHAEEYDTGTAIIAEESLIDPPAWYELDLATGARRLLKRLEVPGYDPEDYRSERRYAPAADGVQIPVVLAYRASTPLDGSAPCLLWGYGSYESSDDPWFERTLPSLLDRGVVFALAHVRGGGECGRAWWQQGRLRSKPTTFTDFIAVADWLAGDGGAPALVDGRRIVSRGLSAGGLLQGAVYSMRPDRWRAVVAEVPFVDVINTMLDPTIPLTITEWDEWGDPRDPGDYACMRSYSPYENPPAGRRPALLATGAANDPRVSIHEPAKWVARLRATDTDGSTILFRPELGAGAHGGPTGRSAQYAYEAEVLAFVLDAMGVTQ